MKTSEKGLNAIVQREGIRLFGYLDIKGIPTIGVGQLGRFLSKKYLQRFMEYLNNNKENN